MERTNTKIGSVEIDGPLMLGPMAGITDLACRLVTKPFGASLVCAPLVSAKALCLGSKKTVDLLVSEPEERPVAIQVFGGDPAIIADAVNLLNEHPFDIIDINMGCPVPKIAGNSGGAALMREPQLASEITRAAVEASNKPVTVKIRSGWDENSINAIEIGQLVEKAGASAIALHPRTKTQSFSGKADWSLIGRLKEAVSIPVIGSGDVRSPEDVERMFDQTGCDLVMIARAARGAPWIFSRTLERLRGKAVPPNPSPEYKIQTLVKHCTLSAKYDGGRRAALKMRKHAGWYIKGLRNAAMTRERINKAQTIDEIIKICEELQKEWHESCSSGDAVKLVLPKDNAYQST